MKWMSIESIADGTFTEKSDVYVSHDLNLCWLLRTHFCTYNTNRFPLLCTSIDQN